MFAELSGLISKITAKSVPSAKLVFLCASALEATRLLLLSRLGRSPNGLDAASGRAGALPDGPHQIDRGGLRIAAPGAIRSRGGALPLSCPLRQPGAAGTAYEPGFGVQVYQSAGNGAWSDFGAVSFAEMLPRAENRVTFDTNQRDAWGIPVLRIDCSHSQAELSRAHEQTVALRAIAEAVGVTLTRIDKSPAPPGNTQP